MRNFTVLVIAFAILLSVTPAAEAKLLPQARGAASSVNKSAVAGIGVYPRLRADRRALLVYFTNLNNAQLVSYMLTYKTNGQQEAAMGGLTLDKSSQTSEILFGTCSKNVCRYHSGITDARLEVSYTTKSGKKYLKKYRIKI